MAGAAGLEPATLCLEGRCSIHLSYAPALEGHLHFTGVLAGFSCPFQRALRRTSADNCSMTFWTRFSAIPQRWRASMASSP